MALPEYYQRYFNRYEGNNLVHEAIKQGDLALEFYRAIPENLEEYRYEPEKWSMKEVLAHIIETERVFGFRLLWFSKNDKSPLPGFDENAWAKEMNIENRKWQTLINELANVRASSIYLLSSLHPDMLQRRGRASEVDLTVEELAKILIGHELHHRHVLKTRYLTQ
ncbi:MAG: DinB family protein [Cyclobacteriaceae bacterium]|nr:DinB family protein [Cyclobacteriaceae bacterium]